MKKETFEWIHSWCDYADKKDLPRVLLIGDSITYGYQELVREKLKGVCYVDYIATSYSCNNLLYTKLIKNFVNNSKYDFIHFSHGLHGDWIKIEYFKKKMTKLIEDLMLTSNVGIATLTNVNTQKNKKPHKKWTMRVDERNDFYHSLAAEKNLPLDDLYSVAISLSLDKRYEDGIHYAKAGYEAFAEVVSEFIKKNIK